MYRFLLCSLLTLFALPLTAKVLIVTHHFNRPEFIQYQVQSLKRFLKDEYKLVIFNDAVEATHRNAIRKEAAKYNLRCIDIPREIHSKPYLYRFPGEDYQHPSVRTANAIQYSLNELAFNFDGNVCILDSDMFLVRPLSIDEIMEEYDICALWQSREGYQGHKVHYLWNGVVFLNMRTLPKKRTLNFNCGIIKGAPLDTGGYTSEYILAHPEVRIKSMNVCLIRHLFDHPELKGDFKHLEFFKPHPMNFEMLFEGNFLHYRSGANWNNRSGQFHRQKMHLLNGFFQTLGIPITGAA